MKETPVSSSILYIAFRTHQIKVRLPKSLGRVENLQLENFQDICLFYFLILQRIKEIEDSSKVDLTRACSNTNSKHRIIIF